MNLEGLGTLLLSFLGAGLPLALAAVGGLVTEWAGSLSIALEGAMLAGAFAAVLAAGSSLGLIGGLVAAMAAGAIVGLLVALAATRLRADVFVAGLGANLLVPPVIAALSYRFQGTKGVVALEPGLAAELSGREGPLLVGSAVVLSLFILLLVLTPYGLRLRAAGEDGEVTRAAGIERRRLRALAHVAGGAAAGLAGALLSLPLAAFVPGMSSGRGWISLAAIYLGARTIPGTLLASLGFGALLVLAGRSQSLGVLPAGLLPAVPYLATLFFYVAVARRRGGSS